MAIPPLPPLRIRESDGSPNVIPVFDIIVTNASVTDNGGGTITLNLDPGAAGASATTAETYIVIANTNSLSSERALTAGLGITIADSGANAGVYVQAATPFLVSSNRTLTAVYPVLSGGNLGADRSFHVDTAFLLTSNMFPVQVGSGGTGQTTFALNNLLIGSAGAPVKTLAVGSANQFLGITSTGTVQHEYKQFNAGSSIAIAYNGTAVIIGKTVTTHRLPMALLTVQPDSSNAFWVAASGTNVDRAHVAFADSGDGIATWWVDVPWNLAAVPNWSLVIKHAADTSGGGNALASFRARTVRDGGTLDGASTLISSAATFTTYIASTQAVAAVSGANFDGILAISGGDYLIVEVNRHGSNASDTLGVQWNVQSLDLRCDVI